MARQSTFSPRLPYPSIEWRHRGVLLPPEVYEQSQYEVLSRSRNPSKAGFATGRVGCHKGLPKSKPCADVQPGLRSSTTQDSGTNRGEK